MARIHFKVTALAVYLLALAVYSTLMLISTLESDLRHQDQDHQHDLKSYEGQVNEAALTRDHNPRFRRAVDHHWLRTVQDFYTRLKTTETSCTKLIQLGGSFCRGNIDNDKFLCLDDDVTLTPGNCTVYSFGIGDDSTFDDQEPVLSTNYKRQHFYSLGLDIKKNQNHTTKVKYVDNNETKTIHGELDTYDGIRARLHHQHRTVHYLKLDIEANEWRVLPYMMERGLLDGVRQLAIEVHTMNIIKAPQHMVLDMLRGYWTVLMGLTRMGFLRAVYRPTVVLESLYTVPGDNTTIPTCFEVLFLRRGPVY
ncbi:putative Methyltransferase domain-containing protein 1 [Homarus americanus]|uniref:Putative Methyltransferase domain-containing protein 1 n=1 Tax=Homarus americanus TaxID=6706 RepID=A0A8J5MZN0_HOMAM|nr:putative Methyltransferase domain-containing protein 1 [Homarus americanus]